MASYGAHSMLLERALSQHYPHDRLSRVDKISWATLVQYMLEITDGARREVDLH